MTREVTQFLRLELESFMESEKVAPTAPEALTPKQQEMKVFMAVDHTKIPGGLPNVTAIRVLKDEAGVTSYDYSHKLNPRLLEQARAKEQSARKEAEAKKTGEASKERPRSSTKPAKATKTKVQKNISPKPPEPTVTIKWRPAQLTGRVVVLPPSRPRPGSKH